MTKFVDTNILARLMTNDVLALSEKAASLVNHYGARELVVLDAVIVELFFVLETNQLYKFSHTLIVELFETIIIPTPQFDISSAAQAALPLYSANPKLDFMDCLLAVSGEYQKQNVLTFDKDLLKVLD